MSEYDEQEVLSDLTSQTGQSERLFINMKYLVDGHISYVEKF